MSHDWFLLGSQPHLILANCRWSVLFLVTDMSKDCVILCCDGHLRSKDGRMKLCMYIYNVYLNRVKQKQWLFTGYMYMCKSNYFSQVGFRLSLKETFCVLFVDGSDLGQTYPKWLTTILNCCHFLHYASTWLIQSGCCIDWIWADFRSPNTIKSV